MKPLGVLALSCLLPLLAGGCGGSSTAVAAAGDGPLAVATTGDDANPCTAAEPCASFDRAYRAAPAGAVVEVAGGR